MSEEKYYIKENGRYNPIGVLNMRDNISDGIWLINSNANSRSFKNLTYYMGGVDTNRVKEYAEAICNQDLLIDAIQNVLDNKKAYFKQYKHE